VLETDLEDVPAPAIRFPEQDIAREVILCRPHVEWIVPPASGLSTLRNPISPYFASDPVPLQLAWQRLEEYRQLKLLFVCERHERLIDDRHMKTKLIPEPFSVSSFRIALKEVPRTEEACLTGLKTPKRHTRQPSSVCCASVTNPLTEALYGQPGQDKGLKALEKDCEAAGSSEPTGVLESSLVRQRLTTAPAYRFRTTRGRVHLRLRVV